MEACLRKINIIQAYQLVKNLTTEKQDKSATVQDKSGKYLTEEPEILHRWSEYCSDIPVYNYKTDGGPTVLDCPRTSDEEPFPILREEATVKALKIGTSA